MMSTSSRVAALNRALDNLDEGLSQVAVSSDQISLAAGQISDGSQSLAQGATQQVRAMSEEAGCSTDKGVESMKRLSQAIDSIKNSSDETARIVKTIDEIAFQTNLLALNAAVEAASEELSAQAEEMRSLVCVFTLSDAGAHPAPPLRASHGASRARSNGGAMPARGPDELILLSD